MTCIGVLLVICVFISFTCLLELIWKRTGYEIAGHEMAGHETVTKCTPVDKHRYPSS